MTTLTFVDYICTLTFVDYTCKHAYFYLTPQVDDIAVPASFSNSCYFRLHLQVTFNNLKNKKLARHGIIKSFLPQQDANEKNNARS